MARREEVSFAQDRNGNEVKALDDQLAQIGMNDESDGGIVGVTSGDAANDTDVIALDFTDDDYEEFIMTEVHAFNDSGSDGTFEVLEASLDSNGNIDSTTRRSVPHDVVAGDSRRIEYDGEPFVDGAVAVNSEFSGDIGVGGYAYVPESHE